MARRRFFEAPLLSVVLVAAGLQTAWSQTSGSQTPQLRPVPTQSVAASAADTTCVVYPLTGLGHDPNAGKWIADTIPDVIEPATWSRTAGDGKCRIVYHAPSKVL